jgi:ketosteroid isomerase-like protein
MYVPEDQLYKSKRVSKGEHFMSTENEVRQVSNQFYAALNRMANGDASPIMELWSHSSDVTTMHPLGGRQLGWEQVRVSWEQAAAIASGGQVTLSDQLIRVVGDMAYEVGTESGEITLAGQHASFEERVTNVYRREAGEWKLVHHHSDTVPALQAILQRLQASHAQA